LKKILVASASLAALAGMAMADWPQFQGPNRDGVSKEIIKLAGSWPAGGPKSCGRCRTSSAPVLAGRWSLGA
jgi:hypothetical protein